LVAGVSLSSPGSKREIPAVWKEPFGGRKRGRLTIKNGSRSSGKPWGGLRNLRFRHRALRKKAGFNRGGRGRIHAGRALIIFHRKNSTLGGDR